MINSKKRHFSNFVFIFTLFVLIGILILSIIFSYINSQINFSPHGSGSGYLTDKSSIKSSQKDLNQTLCYVKLIIDEKIEDGKLNFKINNTENHYGYYASEVSNQYGGDYLLKIIDFKNREILSYYFDSSRFIYYDGFVETDQGGLIELNESKIELVIPYNKEIQRITITHGNKVHSLNINTTKFICSRSCKIENETLDFSIGEACCDGYLPYDSGNSLFMCERNSK